MFSLKINKRGGPNKDRGGRKKIEKLISEGDVYYAPESTLFNTANQGLPNYSLSWKNLYWIIRKMGFFHASKVQK